MRRILVGSDFQDEFPEIWDFARPVVFHLENGQWELQQIDSSTLHRCWVLTTTYHRPEIWESHPDYHDPGGELDISPGIKVMASVRVGATKEWRNEVARAELQRGQLHIHIAEVTDD